MVSIKGHASRQPQNPVSGPDGRQVVPVGIFMEKDKNNSRKLNVYSGPDIKDGEKFDGNKMKDADGAKNYTHYTLYQQGNDKDGSYLLKGGHNVARPSGVNGKINRRQGY